MIVIYKGWTIYAIMVIRLIWISVTLIKIVHNEMRLALLILNRLLV